MGTVARRFLKSSTWFHSLALSGMTLLFLSMLANMAWCQNASTTVIYGQVIDQQKAAVVKAKVTATSPATGLTREAETDETGVYRFVALPPGTYTVEVAMKGFRAERRAGVEALVSTTNRVNFTLQVGAANEIVEVQGTSEALNTSDSSVGNAFSQLQLASLPLEARNVVNLLSLQTGAVFLPVATTNNDSRNGSVSGAHADQSNVTLDGVDVNDPLNSYAYTSVLRASMDSVQEFRVTTSNSTAQAGYSSGAQVALVTKSGTNSYHGSLNWSHRNTSWSANEFFNKLSQVTNGQPNKPPKLQQHDFAGTFGAPIIKNRLFFFGNVDNFRAASQSPVSRAVPSDALRDGVLTYQCATASQCPAKTVQGFTGGHAIPAGYYGLTPAQVTSIDPLGIGPNKALMAYYNKYPHPNDPGRDIYNIAGYRFVSPILQFNWTYLSRIDFNVDRNGNHKVFWRGSLQHDITPGSEQFPGTAPNTSDVNNSKGYAVGYDAVLSPTLVSSFRYGFTRIGYATSGNLNGNFAQIRFIDSVEGNYAGTSTRNIPTHNFVEDLTWIKGKHTWQFGGNLRFTRINGTNNTNSFQNAVANGSWLDGNGRNYLPGTACDAPSTAACLALPGVSSGFTAYGDDWIAILGVLSEANAHYNYNKDGSVVANGVPLKRNYGADSWEMYAQDNWHITPHFNLVLGLHYMLASPPWEVNGVQVAPTVSLNSWFEQRRQNMLDGKPGNIIPDLQVALAGPANGKKGYYGWDKNNFSPRVAFAWNPQSDSGLLGMLMGRGKTVLRGGFGMTYDHIGPALANQFDTVGAFGLSTNLSSPFGRNNENDAALRWQSTTYLPPTLPAAPKGGFPQTPPENVGQIASSLDDSIITPYAQQYNFFISRELKGDMTFDIGYVGHRGYNTLVRRDMAMYEDLVDPKSKMDLFGAAKAVILAGNSAHNSQPANFTGIAPVPYWENLFPGLAGTYTRSGSTAKLTATQAAAYLYFRAHPTDWTTPIYNMDESCSPACSIYGPFSYFSTQYDDLFGISSIGHSEYHSLQATLRKRMSHGVQFDFNYTFSKSNDMGSTNERSAFTGVQGFGGYSGVAINSWDPKLTWGPSDFDLRHQINANWILELPFGNKRRFASGAPGWANAIIGNWQLTGIYRWTSGFPFNVINSRCCWATNWDLQGNMMFVDPNNKPATGVTYNKVAGYPSMFKDPKTALTQLRYDFPGEAGVRNQLRGDGYFSTDMGLGKSWHMPYNEAHQFSARWEVFNITNTPKFNVASINVTPDVTSTFGQYTAAYSGCENQTGRCMQLTLHYSF